MRGQNNELEDQVKWSLAALGSSPLFVSRPTVRQRYRREVPTAPALSFAAVLGSESAKGQIEKALIAEV